MTAGHLKETMFKVQTENTKQTQTAKSNDYPNPNYGLPTMALKFSHFLVNLHTSDSVAVLCLGGFVPVKYQQVLIVFPSHVKGWDQEGMRLGLRGGG